MIAGTEARPGIPDRQRAIIEFLSSLPPISGSEFDADTESASLVIPDVTGLSAYKSALAYSEAGLYLLPVTDRKNPGSVVGKGWPDKSTRDPDVIEHYWDCDKPPGIAIHTGRSGLVVFDLDINVLPAELDWLRTGLIQSSRSGVSDRGHYVFASTEVFINGKLTLADGTVVGEIKSGNGVILTEPSTHSKADTEGGCYRWLTTGLVPDLPEVAREYLTAGAGSGDFDTKSVTDEQVSAFIESTKDANERPKALTALVGKLARKTAGTRDCVRNTLRIAAGEARLGFYPYARAIAEVEKAARQSYVLRGESFDVHIPAREFARLVKNGVGVALARDINELREEANRPYGDKAQRNADLVAGFAVQTESEFWSARDVLADLREFAHSRLVSPWAMLGQVLVRAVAAIPPHVVLPATIGGRGSLNLFVALVGASGDGKGASASAAADWLATEPDPFTATLGSGEGMAKVFAYKSRVGGVWSQNGLRASVLFEAPEVDNLVALTNRSGSTLLPQLRSAYSGETLGFTYADPAKAVRLCAHRYRLCLAVGVQPGRAAPLLHDADGGTPQRFVWLPVLDADMPVQRPEPPPLRVLPAWADVAAVKGARRIVSGVKAQDLLDTPVQPQQLFELGLPGEAVAAIEAHHLARHHGGNVDPLDGHKLQTRLKVAAGLMWLDGRADGIDSEDWKLSGVVMAMSDRTRQSIVKQLGAKRDQEQESLGRRDAIRSDVAEQEKADRAVSRVAENIVKKLTEAGEPWARGELRKKVRRDDRVYFDDAEALLLDSGRITKSVAENNGGSSGHTLALVGEASK